MAYTNQMVLKVGTVTLTGSDNDSKYKMVVPDGLRFRLLAVTQRVTVKVDADTTPPVLTVMKKDGAADAAALKVLTGFADEAAIGTTAKDTVVQTDSISNEFVPGDTLDIQLSTAAVDAASAAGTVNVDLLIALDN